MIVMDMTKANSTYLWLIRSHVVLKCSEMKANGTIGRVAEEEYGGQWNHPILNHDILF